ncbi:MAG TPA: YbgC/FadM family acyl-CoA thioesterase [Aggregatilineales bacterium]|nr:YbgC/FadM family acyl-CoA thioesterase [Aggregatilineales bacterium]
MPRTYTWRFKVRTYEIDQFGHVNNANYLNYLEEAATQASTDAGYSLQWYLEHHLYWLVRKWTIRYFQPAVYGDELEVTTWVSDVRRVRSNREYLMTRPRDGAKIVRARTDWVLVNAATIKPVRIPSEMGQAFEPPNEPLEDLGVRLRNAESMNQHQFMSYRVAQSYEVDLAGHVNNANYLRWIETAYNNAISSVNWSLKRQIEEHRFAIFSAGHEIEYFKPALEGDPIKIISYVTEVARVRGAWIHEIRHAESDELLAREYSVGAFVDISGEQPTPTRIPPEMLNAAVTGIPG